MASDKLSTVIGHNHIPFFTSQYDVVVEYAGGISGKSDLNLQAKSISMGDGFTLKTEYLETIRQHFLTSYGSPKTGTIVFYEQSNLATYLALKKAWLNNIYSEEKNCWLPVDPRGTITISLLGSASIQFTDVIPTGLQPPGQLSWENGTVGNTTFQFSFNRFKVFINGVEAV